MTDSYLLLLLRIPDCVVVVDQGIPLAILVLVVVHVVAIGIAHGLRPALLASAWCDRDS